MGRPWSDVRSGWLVWSIVHFCASLAQQLAELLAPLLLIAGIGWVRAAARDRADPER